MGLPPWIRGAPLILLELYSVPLDIGTPIQIPALHNRWILAPQPLDPQPIILRFFLSTVRFIKPYRNPVYKCTGSR